MLAKIEKQYPEMKGRVADVRFGILLVEQYHESPAYRANLAKMAQAQNELMMDAALDMAQESSGKLSKAAQAQNELMMDGAFEMAQRSMVDQYIDNAMRYVAKGDVPQARLMLKTALAEDHSRGDVRALLDGLPGTNLPRSSATAALSDIHN